MPVFIRSICMEHIDLQKIKENLETVLSSLLNEHEVKKGDIFVIGCSSSEVAGGVIGKDSSEEIGKIIFETAYNFLKTKGLYLACQCCEHLNRALVIERECCDKYGYEEVCVVPWLHGGGSFATAAYHGFKNPVVVEHVKASFGIDIGSTLIGMHLKDVAVPVHPEQRYIGKAYVTAAYCRPKLIGGERAKYR